MIDHVTANVDDLERAKQFYSQALAPLGYSLQAEFPGAAGFRSGEGIPDFWIGSSEARGATHVAFTAPGVLVAPGLEAALQAARGDALRRGVDAVMVIGGGDIYAQAMPFADRLEITQIHASPEGDVRFPAIDPALWRESERESHAAGPDDDAGFDFVTYLKKSRQPPVN